MYSVISFSLDLNSIISIYLLLASTEEITDTSIPAVGDPTAGIAAGIVVALVFVIIIIVVIVVIVLVLR